MNILQLAVAVVISFSLGVVVGRLIKSPVGRWAMLVVIAAALAGGFYLYGAFNTLQTIKQPALLSWLPRLW